MDAEGNYFERDDALAIARVANLVDDLDFRALEYRGRWIVIGLRPECGVTCIIWNRQTLADWCVRVDGGRS